MHLQNNIDVDTKLDLMKDEVSRANQSNLDMKNIHSRWQNDNLYSTNTYFKNKGKVNVNGYFSEKFKSVNQICKNLN